MSILNLSGKNLRQKSIMMRMTMTVMNMNLIPKMKNGILRNTKKQTNEKPKNEDKTVLREEFNYNVR